MQIKVRYGQTIYDIANMYYGDISNVWKLIDDNQLTLDTDLEGGEVLTIDPTFSTNAPITNYFKLNLFVINNSDHDPILGITHILKLKLLQIGNEIYVGYLHMPLDGSGGV